MPYSVKKRGEKYRLLDQNGRIAKTKNGKAMDGGGKKSKAAVERQMTAINISEAGRGKKRK